MHLMHPTGNLIYSSVSLACQTLSEMSDPIVACDTEDKVAQDNTSVVQESPTSPTTATASDAISDKEKGMFILYNLYIIFNP